MVNNMDNDIKLMFDKVDGEYLKFEHISEKDRLHPDPTLCGYLYIFNRLENKKFEMSAEHDIVYLACPDDFEWGFNEDDALYLTRCGIHYNEDFDCLADFV